MKKVSKDVVTFTGQVPNKELLTILTTADVWVNPDKPREMNNISTVIKIMERMALGKPIVQFDLKEGRYSAESPSLYADNHNHVAGFAANILWLPDRPEERQRMREIGRKKIQESLAWEYSVPQLLGADRRCLAKNGRLRIEGLAATPEKTEALRNEKLAGDKACVEFNSMIRRSLS